jgi:hypothetical protein
VGLAPPFLKVEKVDLAQPFSKVEKVDLLIIHFPNSVTLRANVNIFHVGIIIPYVDNFTVFVFLAFFVRSTFGIWAQHIIHTW